MKMESAESMNGGWARFGEPVLSWTRVTLFGRARRFEDVTCGEWFYGVAGVLASLTTMALTVERLFSLDPETDDYIFAWVLLINTVFCLSYLFVAIMFEQASEILVFVAATVVVTIYVVLNFVSGPGFPDASERKGLIKIVRLVCVALFGSVLIPSGAYLAWTYKESNSLVFRTVGADATLQRGCKLLYCLHSMLKFHIQVEASMVALALDAKPGLSVGDIAVIAAGAVFIVGTRIIVYLALRFESGVLCFVYWPLTLVESGFVGWKFYDAIDAAEATSVLFDGIFFTGALCVLFQLAINVALVVYKKHYFGKGLKEKVYGGYFERRRTGRPYQTLP